MNAAGSDYQKRKKKKKKKKEKKKSNKMNLSLSVLGHLKKKRDMGHQAEERGRGRGTWVPGKTRTFLFAPVYRNEEDKTTTKSISCRY